MNKIQIDISKNFCPHPMSLFLYGTYKEDDTPNFGLFSWLNFCWNDTQHVMACLDGEKLTKDRIHANGAFSANLVTEPLLPVADYLGHTSGYKQNEMILETIAGSALHVPILKDSPWAYELKVIKTIPLNGSEIYVCRICNVLADKEFVYKNISAQNAPIVTTSETYFSLMKRGNWGDWKNKTI